MPKNMSPGLLAQIQAGGLQDLTVLVLVQRVDGITLGFTSWDVPIVYGGITYEPAIAMNPSSVKTNSDLITDQMDIVGAIDSVYLTEPDIEGGRYDLATVTIMRINPFNTSLGVIVDLTGTVGQVSFGDGKFQVAVNSIGQQLNQQIGDIITPSCRVRQLGDSQCKVNIADYQFSVTVFDVESQSVIGVVSSAISQTGGYFNFGMVRFAEAGAGGGSNFSINMEIKTSAPHGVVGGLHQQILTLVEELPFPINIGDVLILEAGCDRSPLTCRSKFNNLVNIHAEPYVPGNDYLLTVGIPPTS